MMFKYSILVLIAILLLTSCETAEPLPNTPESVSRQWQEYLNNNEFEEAKKLSTPNAKEWLSWIEKMILQEESGDETPPPIFLEMHCRQNQKQATCVYLQKDDGEEFRDSFLLVKTNGQWFVDIPQEDLEMDETFEQMINDLENIIEEEASE